MELPLSPFSVGCSSLVVTDSQWVTNPSPTSSKTLVNTKFVWIPEIGLETFPRETEVILLEVSLAPCFLWAVSWGPRMGVWMAILLIAFVVLEEQKNEGRVWCWKIFVVRCQWQPGSVLWEATARKRQKSRGREVLGSRQSPGSCWGLPAPPLKLVKTLLTEIYLQKCEGICRGNVIPLSTFTTILGYYCTWLKLTKAAVAPPCLHLKHQPSEQLKWGTTVLLGAVKKQVWLPLQCCSRWGAGELTISILPVISLTNVLFSRDYILMD